MDVPTSTHYEPQPADIASSTDEPVGVSCLDTLNQLMVMTLAVSRKLDKTEVPAPFRHYLRIASTAIAQAQSALGEAIEIEGTTEKTIVEQRKAAERDRAIMEEVKKIEEPEEGTGNTVEPRILREAGMGDGFRLISGRAGYLSLREWELLCEGRLQELDEVLRGIVKKVCVLGVDWRRIGLTIRSDLNSFGIRFAYTSDISRNYDTRFRWQRMTDPSCPDFEKILYILEFCDPGEYWYTHEMLQAVRRLMELRNFTA